MKAKQNKEGIMNRVSGIISLGLAALSFIVGLLVIAGKSIKAAALYSIILLAAPSAAVYFFCTKCPGAEKGCGHVLPGILAGKLGKRTGEYSASDIVVMIASIGGLVIFPQPWLMRQPKYLLLFWTLLLTAFFQIRLCVCKVCTNDKCPGYPK